MSQIYFRGRKGIENPVDMDGQPIQEGDILTYDWADFDDYPEGKKLKPVYRVVAHPKGGLCGRGIDTDLYLHDFRFNKTRRLNEHTDSRK